MNEHTDEDTSLRTARSARALNLAHVALNWAWRGAQAARAAQLESTRRASTTFEQKMQEADDWLHMQAAHAAGVAVYRDRSVPLHVAIAAIDSASRELAAFASRGLGDVVADVVATAEA
jgi:hypothetical protein